MGAESDRFPEAFTSLWCLWREPAKGMWPPLLIVALIPAVSPFLLYGKYTVCLPLSHPLMNTVLFRPVYCSQGLSVLLLEKYSNPGPFPLSQCLRHPRHPLSYRLFSVFMSSLSNFCLFIPFYPEVSLIPHKKNTLQWQMPHSN